MVLPTRTPPETANPVRALDRAWAERLGAEAERYERVERSSGLRRAGVCLLAAAAVVMLGVAGFRFETDTRHGPVIAAGSPAEVVVTLARRPAPEHPDGARLHRAPAPGLRDQDDGRG